MKFEWVALLTLSVLLVANVTVTFAVILSQSQLFVFLPVVRLRQRPIELILLFDKTSCVFLTTVTLISVSVFVFSRSYISADKFYIRFSVLLLSFVISMLVLILCPNLFSILLGWDGLGVSSYLLVIYYNREKSYNAGIVTALTNRLGDVIIIRAIGLLASQGHWNTIVSEIDFLSDRLLQSILVVGCFTKSAQIPFSAWLPAAIAAPTPVSSLVHSSTLVTAGVYVLIRHTEHIDRFAVSDLVIITGMGTIIIARTSALAESDMKKMVALSTLSQLGVIIISIGLGWILISFIHLVIHAYFKAIIFIRTGNAIHVSNNYQSCSKTGSLILSTPLNSSSLVCGGFSLAGAPFAAAFFSKEPILESMLQNPRCSLYDYLLILTGVALTVMYTSRFIRSVIRGIRKLEAPMLITESDSCIDRSVKILFAPSFTSGVVMRSRYRWFRNKLILYPDLWKLSALIIILGGVVLAISYSRTTLQGPSHHYHYNMWAMPSFSSSLLNTGAFSARGSSHVTNFSLPILSIVSVIESTRGGPMLLLIESKLVFRLIVLIPIVVLIVLIIRI